MLLLLLPIFILASTPGFAGPPPNGARICGPLLTAPPDKILAERKIAFTNAIEFAKTFPYFEKTRVVPALEAALRKRSVSGMPLPVLREATVRNEIDAARQLLNRQWAKNLEGFAPEIPNFEGKYLGELNSSMKSVPGADQTEVKRYLKDSEQFVFRRATPRNTNAARKTLAASILNRKMSLATVTESTLVRVNGETGVLSNFAKGTNFETQEAFQKITSASKYDAEAFEFLIGNPDLRNENFFGDEHGLITDFDLSAAFLDEVLNYNPEGSWTLFGNYLPDFYTDKFVKSITALSADNLASLLKPHLTSFEMDGVLFRREIILEDLRIRGPGVILPNRSAGLLLPF